MGTRDFQIFEVRYIGDIGSGKFMKIAVCMSEVSDGGSPFLGCEYTNEWARLEALFPDADIDFLKNWCEAVRKEFCCPDTSRLVQEGLEDCSSNIDVLVSRKTLNAADDPGEEMRKLLRVHSG
jgi:hypothetical protein